MSKQGQQPTANNKQHEKMPKECLGKRFIRASERSIDPKDRAKDYTPDILSKHTTPNMDKAYHIIYPYPYS